MSSYILVYSNNPESGKHITDQDDIYVTWHDLNELKNHIPDTTWYFDNGIWRANEDNYRIIPLSQAVDVRLHLKKYDRNYQPPFEFLG